MKNCNEIQQIIAELEFNQVLDDKMLMLHLESCKDCQAYKQACDEMNQAMSQLSDFDADDGLVESTLSSIVNIQDEETKPKTLLNTQWASALAASFMLVSLIALFPYNSISNFGLSSVSTMKYNDRINQQKLEESDNEIQFSAANKPISLEEEKIAIAKRKEALQRKKEPNMSDYEFYDVDISKEVVQKKRRIARKPNSPKLTANIAEKGLFLGAGSVNSQISDIDFRKEIKQGFKDALSNQPKLEAPKPIYGRAEENKSQSMGNEIAESVAKYEDDQDKVMLDRVVTTGSRIRATDFPIQNEQPVVDGFSVQKYPNDDNVDKKISKKYAGTFAHRYSQTISQDDEVELNKVTVTGSRIRASDLEEPLPVIIISRDDSDVFTENLSTTRVGKLSKAKEKQGLESRNRTTKEGVITKQSKGTRLNSEGIGQALIYPHSGVKENRQTKKDSLLDNAIPLLETIKPLTAAQYYLSEMNSLDNLSYQTASGYWSNTYLPGDSSMRLLEASLSDNNALIFNNSIKQNIQPFDYPDNSALAVYLNSDVANVESQKPTRMRIQVGIQASNRQGGQRSAMNIGLVFDIHNKTAEYAANMKALLLALLKSKQPGDNISLTVAGNSGGVLIEPKDFRHGQIQVVMNNLFLDKKHQISNKTTKA